MSADTWTPTALASELVAWQGSGWRAVEAQHKIATMGLVHGDVAAQALLEDILEETNPCSPRRQGTTLVAGHPFDIGLLPGGSRFRRREDPGIFYGAGRTETACAEAG